MAQYEEYLGEAIVDMVNIFRPEMLLLGGGISGEGKALTDPMNEYVKAHCFGGDKSFVTRVDTATLGNKAGIIGAAALCLSAPAAMPLKLAPAFKDYLWGGERLKSEYGKHTRLSPLAESWELSCHKDGPSTIVNGPDAGRTLAEYAARHPACVGTRHTDGVFPVLIKLIDAARPLSVQVHPDDAYAQRVEGEPGKTEMWYVVDAQPGAQLYYGFQRELTREEAARRIADGTLTDVLNAVPVKAGDVFSLTPVPCTPLARASLSPRSSRIPTPPTACSITAVWARTESPAHCTWKRPWTWHACARPSARQAPWGNRNRTGTALPRCWPSAVISPRACWT